MRIEYDRVTLRQLREGSFCEPQGCKAEDNENVLHNGSAVCYSTLVDLRRALQSPLADRTSGPS